MDKYIVAPPNGSTNNGIGASDRKWQEGHFETLPNWQEYLAESTGYGIVSGCEPSINGLTVTVGAGVVHLSDGTRKELSATNITLDNADPTNPRIDLVYITSPGEVAKITGTASASPSVPTLPTGGISVCNVTIAAGATTRTVTDSRDFALVTNKNVMTVKEGYFEKLVTDDIISKGPWVDVRAFGAVGDGVTDDTAAFSAAVAYSKNIFIPAGTYLITETIDFSNASTSINGAGREFTKIIFTTDDKSNILFNNVGSNSTISDLSIQGTRIESDGNVTYYGNIITGAYHRYTIKNVDFKYCNYAIAGTGREWYGVNKFYNVRFQYLNRAVRGTELVNNYVSFLQCEFYHIETILNVRRVNCISFISCDFEFVSFVFDKGYSSSTLYNGVLFQDCYMEMGGKILTNNTTNKPPLQGNISIIGGYLLADTDVIKAVNGDADYKLFLSIENVCIKSSVVVFALSNKCTGIFRGAAYDHDGNATTASRYFSGSHTVLINPGA